MLRLKTRPQFQAAMAGGVVSRTAHFALHRLLLADAPPTGPGSPEPQALFSLEGVWLGAMVPKRWARRAVTRNTIRRQIYAVGAERLAALPGVRLVRQHAGFSLAQFPSATSPALRGAVRAELLELLAREPS